MRKKRYTRCYRCGKTARLFRCKNCGKYFCSEHSNPKMPLTAEIVFNEKDPVLSQLYEKEWRKGGHACVPYGEWKLNEIKNQHPRLMLVLYLSIFFSFPNTGGMTVSCPYPIGHSSLDFCSLGRMARRFKFFT